MTWQEEIMKDLEELHVDFTHFFPQGWFRQMIEGEIYICPMSFGLECKFFTPLVSRKTYTPDCCDCRYYDDETIDPNSMCLRIKEHNAFYVKWRKFHFKEDN